MAAKNYVTNSYGSVKYWDDRYAKQKEITFDWVEQYAEIRSQLNVNVLEPLFDIFCKE